jgi:hypothetical protein
MIPSLPFWLPTNHWQLATTDLIVSLPESTQMCAQMFRFSTLTYDNIALRLFAVFRPSPRVERGRG